MFSVLLILHFCICFYPPPSPLGRVNHAAEYTPVPCHKFFFMLMKTGDRGLFPNQEILLFKREVDFYQIIELIEFIEGRNKTIEIKQPYNFDNSICYKF